MVKISLRSKRFRLVSEQWKIVERDFRLWLLEKRNEDQKMKEGEGEGKERNVCRQTLRFWKPAFASERSAWLARLVEQYWHVSIKVCFILRGHVWYVTRILISCSWCLFWSKARAFSLTSFETQRSSPPLPALLLAPIFAWSLTLVPHSLLPEPHRNACYVD